MSNDNAPNCYACAHMPVCKHHDMAGRARPNHDSDAQIKPYIDGMASVLAKACRWFSPMEGRSW